MQMLQYGGYGIGTNGYENGAYLDLVPAWSQYVTGTTTFVVPSDSNEITVRPVILSTKMLQNKNLRRQQILGKS